MRDIRIIRQGGGALIACYRFDAEMLLISSIRYQRDLRRYFSPYHWCSPLFESCTRTHCSFSG